MVTTSNTRNLKNYHNDATAKAKAAKAATKAKPKMKKKYGGTTIAEHNINMINKLLPYITKLKDLVKLKKETINNALSILKVTDTLQAVEKAKELVIQVRNVQKESIDQLFKNKELNRLQQEIYDIYNELYKEGKITQEWNIKEGVEAQDEINQLRKINNLLFKVTLHIEYIYKMDNNEQLNSLNDILQMLNINTMQEAINKLEKFKYILNWERSNLKDNVESKLHDISKELGIELQEESSLPSPTYQHTTVSPLKQQKDLCTERLIFWSQNRLPSCWFNAILISAFYSQKIRKELLRSSKTWNIADSYDINKKILFKTFHHVLYHTYVKSDKPEEDRNFLNYMNPTKILSYLHKYNPVTFMHNHRRGFNPSYYLRGFFELLNVSFVMINAYTASADKYNDQEYEEEEKEFVLYSPQNFVKLVKDRGNEVIIPDLQDKEIIEHKLQATPSVLAIKVSPEHFYHTIDWEDIDDEADYLVKGENKKNILSLADEIIYNNTVYVLDAVILQNYNKVMKDDGSKYRNHAIVGITCGGKRYVYNGWITNKYKDKDSPCVLMKHDWNVKNHNAFCLDTRNCRLDPEIDKDDLCFSFSQGNRILLYVKTNRSPSKLAARSASKSASRSASSLDSVQSMNITKTPEHVAASFIYDNKRQLSPSYESPDSSHVPARKRR